jgi:hypothetical protein
MALMVFSWTDVFENRTREAAEYVSSAAARGEPLEKVWVRIQDV